MICSNVLCSTLISRLCSCLAANATVSNNDLEAMVLKDVDFDDDDEDIEDTDGLPDKPSPKKDATVEADSIPESDKESFPNP